MKTIFPLLLIFSAILIWGCSSSNNSGSSALTGTNWVMFEMDGNKYEPATGKALTLVFEKSSGQVNGDAPCNSYSSGYTKSGNKLSFGNILATEKACGELETETAYFKLLQRTFAYQISGDKLYLFDSGGMVIFRFREK